MQLIFHMQVDVKRFRAVRAKEYWLHRMRRNHMVDHVNTAHERFHTDAARAFSTDDKSIFGKLLGQFHTVQIYGWWIIASNSWTRTDGFHY